jgi:osmoprotectant transport system permease protein
VSGVRRRWLPPLLLAAATAALLVWAGRGDLGPGEVAVLGGVNLRRRVREHIVLSATSTLLAVATAVPAGIAATRPALRRLGPPALFLANLGQTVPTTAALALMFTVTGIGFRTAILALWAYSLLPVLRNTVAGLLGVDRAVVEAAQGMGMSPGQVLFRVELPLAWPILVAGVRTAAVVNVGTAALATFVGAGGLGAVIQVGIANQRDRILLVGAGLTALLALAVDWAVGMLREVVLGARSLNDGGERRGGDA